VLYSNSSYDFNIKCGIDTVGIHTVVLYDDIIYKTLFTLLKRNDGQ